MKIYVSGPFTTKPDGQFHNNTQEMESNLQNALRTGIELAKKGHEPYVPHTHIGPAGKDLSYDELMRINLSFLSHWADAMIFLGPSRGADIEKAEAEKQGIPVFNSIKEIGKFIPSQKPVPCKQRRLQLPLLRLQSRFA